MLLLFFFVYSRFENSFISSYYYHCSCIFIALLSPFQIHLDVSFKNSASAPLKDFNYFNFGSFHFTFLIVIYLKGFQLMQERFVLVSSILLIELISMMLKNEAPCFSPSYNIFHSREDFFKKYSTANFCIKIKTELETKLFFLLHFNYLFWEKITKAGGWS